MEWVLGGVYCITLGLASEMKVEVCFWFPQMYGFMDLFVKSLSLVWRRALQDLGRYTRASTNCLLYAECIDSMRKLSLEPLRKFSIITIHGRVCLADCQTLGERSSRPGPMEYTQALCFYLTTRVKQAFLSFHMYHSEDLYKDLDKRLVEQEPHKLI